MEATHDPHYDPHYRTSRKTVAVAILALMIAVGALTTRTVHIVTAPAIASGLTLAQTATGPFKSL